MPSRKPQRADDGRLKANLPAKRRAKPREKTRLMQLIDGDITVEDLDTQELARGQTKNKAGTFSGRPPKMLPRDLVLAMQVEWKKRVQASFQESTDLAHQVLLEVAMDPRAQAQARVNAAALLLDRSVGKVTEKVEQTTVIKKFEKILEDVIVEADIESEV